MLQAPPIQICPWTVRCPWGKSGIFSGPLPSFPVLLRTLIEVSAYRPDR
jgi:hypothetical protein